VILTSTEKEALRLKRVLTKYFRNRMKLELSQEKTYVTDLRTNGIHFLGFVVKAERKRKTPDPATWTKHLVGKPLPDMERLGKKIKKLLEEVHRIELCQKVNVQAAQIQNRLIALHYLDCPWKSSDLEQREGRILRQGNRNKKVKIFRYVTENTFDSYMWQILENKQKFISQIMTSKSPVRACDDVDDTALSYAEIKALATGNPYIKEKMDLDIQVSKLKLLKANHTSQIYRLESDIARRYPREIAAAKGQIEALKTDIESAKPLLAQDKDHFAMEISGTVYTERKEAGAAIIEACKALKAAGTEGRIGKYGSFELHSRFDNFDKVFRLSIKGAWNYSMEVGKDAQGNILRVTNALAGIERALPQVERRLETLEQQLAQAKEEASRPFVQEDELEEKSARLAELNALLNIDEKGSEDALGVDEDAAEIEVADRPRQSVNYTGRVAERSADSVRKPSVLAQLHAKQAERTAEPQKTQKRKSHDMEL